MIELTMGERIKDLICAAGKTQKQVANESGVKEATLSEICNDVNKEFGYNNFIKLAKYFGVSTDYLLGLTDVKTPDIDTQSICKKTHLKEEAVTELINDIDISDFINFFLSESECDFVSVAAYFRRFNSERNKSLKMASGAPNRKLDETPIQWIATYISIVNTSTEKMELYAFKISQEISNALVRYGDIINITNMTNEYYKYIAKHKDDLIGGHSDGSNS